jgi:hypothetical protein
MRHQQDVGGLNSSVHAVLLHQTDPLRLSNLKQGVGDAVERGLAAVRGL